jgi:predicted dehydrogenase
MLHQDEFAHFATRVENNVKPSVITPEESMAAVEACLGAEKSAATGRIVKV